MLSTKFLSVQIRATAANVQPSTQRLDFTTWAATVATPTMKDVYSVLGLHPSCIFRG